MQNSILKLHPQPKFIIVDGNSSIALSPSLFTGEVLVKNTVKRFSEKDCNTFNNIHFSCIVKGDLKFTSIAVASVLAKTYRNEFMNRIHDEFPMYNWKQNKGYPTKEHREVIKK